MPQYQLIETESAARLRENLTELAAAGWRVVSFDVAVVPSNGSHAGGMLYIALFDKEPGAPEYRALAFEDAAREMESLRGSPEAEAAFKRGAEVLRACAAHERWA